VRLLEGPFLRRAALLAACVTALLGAFFLLVRPWYRSWGADASVQGARLPGDHLLWQGAPRETRAVTVQAPAARVWPWIAQLGQDRAGFYSYELLEDLAGAEMTNLDVLIPALQHWRAGDSLWMYPPDKAGGIGRAPLALVEPGRALVFYTRRPGTTLTEPPDGTWAFVVEPVDAARARVIVRSRARGHIGLLGATFERGVFEPAHFAMERKMLEGIRDRAEGRRVARWRDDLQVMLWAMTFALFVASGLLILCAAAPVRHAATFTLLGALLVVLTLVQPSVFVGAPLVVGATLAVVVPVAHRRRRGVQSS
jgi:hypothetical protein